MASATINLQGPSVNPALPIIYPVDINNAVNAALLANYNAAGGAVTNRAPGFSVQDFGATGNGTTDDTAAISALIASSVGKGPVIFPGVQGTTTTPAVYLISSGLVIPSYSHLIIDPGATIMLAPGIATNQGMLNNSGSSNILIELYGTIDGNVVNQPTGGQVHGGITGDGVTNMFVTGGRSGVIRNMKSWPVNITRSTNVEVRGLHIMDSGNTCEFAGISTRWQVQTAGSSYNNGSGATVLVTTTPHGIVPGQTFMFTGSTTNIPFANLMGEYTAGAGTAGTTVNFTGPIGLNATINASGSTSNVSTAQLCYNVGFVDCIVEGIEDLGIALYSGCVGSYIRGCEVRYSSGPFIFSDNSQPAPCQDCELSNNYCHDGAGGPVVTSNAFGGVHHNSRVFNNVSANNYSSGGLNIAAIDGAEVYDNLVHNCVPAVPSAGGVLAQICTSAIIQNGQNLNFWGNTIRDPAAAILPGSTSFVILAAGSTYDNTTGAVSLHIDRTLTIASGGEFVVNVIRGTGNTTALRGRQIATAGTGGTTVNFDAAPGLGVTIFDGRGFYAIPYPASTTIVTGTYDSPTGNVSLTTLAAHGLSVNNLFILPNVSGTGVAALDGLQRATTGTTGTTLNFTDTAGLPAMTITGGRVLPPNVGVGLYPNGFHGGISDKTRITNNFIGDTQGSSSNMVACIAGTWGTNGYSGGNVYGNRLGVIADISNYQPGLNGAVQGPSQDTVFETSVGNYIAAGKITFPGSGQAGVYPLVLQPGGLTPDWNLSSGAGEIDFYCGRGPGAPGGFTFLQVAPITTSTGTYNGGTGAVVLTTRVPHGMLQGSVFTVSGVSNNSPAIGFLDGSQTATGGTGGTTLNYTDTAGIGGIRAFTGGTVTLPGGAQVSVTGGSYTSGSGAVSLTTASAHGLSVGDTFVVSVLSDGDPAITSLNGSHTATAGTTGSTLDFTDSTGLSITFAITAASIVPAGSAGAAVDSTVGVSGSLLANDGLGNTRLGGALVQGAMQTASLVNAGTITVNHNTGFVLIQNTTSIATASVVLPAPQAGQFANGAELELNFQNAVGALTVTAATGASVVNPPTAVSTAGASFNFINVGTVWTRRIAL